jgi:hypothetical protein
MTRSSLKPKVFTSTSVHRRLTRDLTVLVLLLISVFFVFTYLYSKQIQNEITIRYISSAQKMVISKYSRIFEPISNNLNLSRQWAELESLNTNKRDVFNKRFIPVLETLPQISSVILATSEGKEYFFTKKDDKWLSRHLDSELYGPKVFNFQLLNGNNQLIKEWQEETTYKPDTRPWFQLAPETNNSNPIKWTTPYSFYTQQIPGITGVTRWKDANNVDYILAFDVTLSDVAQALSAIRISQNDMAYLLSPQGDIILPPGNHPVVKGTAESGSLYSTGNDSKNYIIFDSVTNWLNNQSQLNAPTSFTRNGQRWWYKVFVLDTRHNSIYAGVIIPEKKLITIFSENIQFILTGLITLIVIAVFMANYLVRKYSHQLKDLPLTSISRPDFSNEVYKLIRQGESETLEFKSTMRKNLKSGKNGKEIELAWLKGVVGFMNTNGGILLIGVDDSGTILGIDADEFENEDKILLHFKNLLSQHIGLEFSKFINLIIDQVEDKTILVVECERSDRPAFLYNKNDEFFYIRSGPASVNLSVSKVIKYIQNRY